MSIGYCNIINAILAIVSLKLLCMCPRFRMGVYILALAIYYSQYFRIVYVDVV